MKNDLSISSKSKRSDFPEKWRDWEFEKHKVKLFQEQIQGWTLDVLKEIKTKVGHSDFAMLSVMMSYFENIQKFKDGYDRTGRSEAFFTEGLKWVYPKFKSHKDSDALAKVIYEQARCGMYHVGLTGTKIVLDCSISSGIGIIKGNIKICPSKLMEDIQNNFDKYVKDLKDPSNVTLRANFEKRLKYIWDI
jgi:hypothetical protein